MGRAEEGGKQLGSDRKRMPHGGEGCRHQPLTEARM